MTTEEWDEIPQFKPGGAIIPFIGKRYEVISGHYKGFVGECVSYDLEKDLPVIIQDDKWNSRAVRLEEIQPLSSGETDISNEQKS